MALGRCGVCESAATTGRDTLEHRGGTTGQRGAPANPHRSGCDEPVVGVGAGDARCLPVVADGHVDRRVAAGLQHAASLSPGWRPDPSLSAVVRTGTRPQPDGGHGPRFCGRCWVLRPRHVEWQSFLARGNRRLHAAELLGRPASTRRDCCYAWPGCRGGLGLPARAAGRRRRWAPTGSAGSAGSRSTHSKPEGFVRTARHNSSQRCAWTAENSIPCRSGLLAPIRAMARRAAVFPQGSRGGAGSVRLNVH
jgi:hypothetical protein